MARPTKQGIDYFPLSVDFDQNVEMYLLEKESNGLAVLVTIWQLIYKNEGYYIKNGADLLLLVKKRISLNTDIIKDCVNACLSRDIFSLFHHKRYGILTSSGIQKRYFGAADKKKEVRVIKEYLLTDIDSHENIIYAGINPEDSGGNATKKRKVKESKKKYGENVFLSDVEFKKLEEKHGKIMTERFIEKLDNYKSANGKKYKSDYGAILTWVVDAIITSKPERIKDFTKND